MEKARILIAQPCISGYERYDPVNAFIFGLRIFLGSVAHKQQLEQLFFLPCKGNVGNAAGLIRRICSAHHLGAQKRLILGICRTHDLILHLLHILKKAEHRLCGRAELRCKASGRERCHSAPAHNIQRRGNYLFSRKLHSRRHYYHFLIFAQLLLRN